jgi:hypothetical protein
LSTQRAANKTITETHARNPRILRNPLFSNILRSGSTSCRPLRATPRSCSCCQRVFREGPTGSGSGSGSCSDSGDRCSSASSALRGACGRPAGEMEAGGDGSEVPATGVSDAPSSSSSPKGAWISAPHVGHGPSTPASSLGTESGLLQAGQWKCR